MTPAHQFPLGVVLAWARRRDALVIEDDYDAGYGYDRAPRHRGAPGVGARSRALCGFGERALVVEAARRGIGIYGVSAYYAHGAAVPPALVLGYAALPEPAIEAGLAELGRLLATARA